MPSSVAHSLRRILVVYSSQTGQAQAIAEDVRDKAPDHGYSADLHCVSQTEKTFWLEKESHAIIITSTTGDGDTPDTAQKFWRRLKKKTLPTDHLKNLQFALLGLGDTNYSNFCNCGKMVRQRLLELGAKPVTEPAWADDGTGLELVVEPWIDNLWSCLDRAFTSGTGDEIEGGTGSNDSLTNGSVSETDGKETDRQDPVGTGEMEGIESLSSSTDITPKNVPNKPTESTSEINENARTEIKDPTETKTPEGPSSPESEVGGEGSEDTETLTHSVPPLSESGLTLPVLPAAYLKLNFGEEDTELQEVRPELQNDCPFPSSSSDVIVATVTSAKQLTRDDAVKKTLLLTLDIKDCDWQFMPGDAIGVLAPNPEAEVDLLLERLGIVDQSRIPYQLDIIADTKKRNAVIPPHIPPRATLYSVLRHSCDIRSPPKKALLRSLADHATSSVEKRRLQELCSRQGGESYQRYVREAGVGIIDILTAFPSTNPPITLLLEQLPRLQPRPYSIASSSLAHPGTVDIVFNVVCIPRGDGRYSDKLGVCTGYLDNATRAIQQKINPAPSLEEKVERISLELPELGIYLRSNKHFRPCEDLTKPIIMIGPGTGVAPFIGFLQHREEQLRRRAEDGSGDATKVGDVWLYFGCRHKVKDYIFRSELEHYVTSGVLTHLRVCHSRDDVTEGGCRYVQDLLTSDAEAVARDVSERQGVVYVCGDARGMARDVSRSITAILRQYKGLIEEEAEVYVKDLRSSKRYLEDVWS